MQNNNQAPQKTAGQIYTESLEKLNEQVRIQDILAETEQNYLKDLRWCIEHVIKGITCEGMKGHESCNSIPDPKKDFFVEVRTKAEKLLHGVMRQYFTPRLTCPQPAYDQTVWQYIYNTQEIKFIWCLPDKKTYNKYKKRLHLCPFADVAKTIADIDNGVIWQKFVQLAPEINPKIHPELLKPVIKKTDTVVEEL